MDIQFLDCSWRKILKIRPPRFELRANKVYALQCVQRLVSLSETKPV